MVEAETGAVIGPHSGYWFYTPGQRSGIKLAGGPWYDGSQCVGGWEQG